MLILKPIAHETIWGGQTLTKYFPEPHDKIGHMYSLFDDEKSHTSNIILNGDYKGKTFHEYFSDKKNFFGLARFEYFPLVLAMVEAAENLSLQVHPDDSAAKEIENAPYGKNESWYFLQAPKSGEIFNGTKCSSVEEVKKLVTENRLSELADTLPISVGDYVYVNAGTLHAITSGAIVYEIEENAEYTYRVYDFDRADSAGKKRPLHIQQALKSLKPELKSVTKHYDGEITERLYTTKLLDSLKNYQNVSDTLECLTVIDENADSYIDGAKLYFGVTIVLEPKEKISVDVGKTMMSRVKI